MSNLKNNTDCGSVFLSYSHLDAERIKPYHAELKNQSIPFWYDKELHAGGNFNNEIAHHIKACDAFLLFLSSNSASSWYVADELTYARNNRKRVIVIRLDKQIDLPDGMELLLGNLHYVDGSESNTGTCIHEVSRALYEGDAVRAEPVQAGKLNHNSDLLMRCRQSFEHFASQLGVRNLEESIDPNLFCSIYPAQGNEKERPVELYTEICEDDHTHIMLQADGGLGKTYTFLSTMKQLLDCDRPCAYIPCHLFTETAGQGLGLILGMLCLTYLNQSNKSEAELNVFFRRQTDKTFILFLDGFNEAVAKAQLSSEIIHLSNTFPNIKIVVSSRYTDSIFVNYAHYTMKGLSRNRVRKVLAGYGRNYDTLTYSLQRLLLTPMFLRLFVQIGQQTDREIDTAAELMDQERKRILGIIQRGNSKAYIKSAEQCLNHAFPEFVRQEYCSNNRRLSFYGERLKKYLKEHTQELLTPDDVFSFLTEYSIIHEGDERTNSFTYQHEHYRDYWVAYAVFQDLLRCVENYEGPNRANALIDTMDGSYSQTVLRFVGELAQVNLKGNVLDGVLNSLRRSAVQDDEVWLSDRNAKATAKLIDIYRIVLDGEIIGIDLNELNLSVTQLNRARTCTRNTKAAFRGSLIDESTFVVSMHESAPRRVEVLRLEDRCYLVTISNTDLLIATLPELDYVWRYPHLARNGDPVSTHELTTSVILGSCIMAVDSSGDVWEWDFTLENDVPCVSPVRKHEEAKTALKVFPWSDEYGQLIALQCKDDGRIVQYEVVPDRGVLEPIDEYYSIDDLTHVDTRKTITSSHLHTFFCWAIAAEDGIQIWKYDTNEGKSSVICFIPDRNVIPDYMICVGSEQSSRDSRELHFGSSERDGSMLVLVAINQEYTNLYQINLPKGSLGEARYIQLEWSEGRTKLDNQYNTTQRKYNRINAMSFAGDKMLLAASDGCIYHYTFDKTLGRYVPDEVAPWIRLAATTFAVEDVLYVPMNLSEDASLDRKKNEIEIAAVSVDRSVHLIEKDSLFPKKKLPGYNDGLRRLMHVNDNLVMVTSYDGCVLELYRKDDRMLCRDKLPVGNWCWALERISSSIYAVGYMSGLALVDISRDEILYRINGFAQKVEHLLYLPDIERTLISVSQDAVRVYEVVESNGKLLLADKGRLSVPESSASYWIKRDGNALFISINGEKESDPRIARFDLSMPLVGQLPTIMRTGSKYGRIRDIHLLGDYLMASGLCGNDGEAKSSQVCLYDVSDFNTAKLLLTIEGFNSYIVHSAIFSIGEGIWRAAIIDSQSNGQLYQYTIHMRDDGLLSADLASTHVFPAKLCDVAFDDKGDLLLTCLNGYLYGKQWFNDAVDKLFRNKCYMLTFGTDMSDMYRSIDPKSRLGWVLTDFGNRLERTRRGSRVIRG